MNIRKAKESDISRLQCLLHQVCEVHHEGRKDLFKSCGSKYTDEELALLLQDPKRPVFVTVDEKDEVMGYAFCILEEYQDHNIFTDRKTLYLDDLCVEETKRHQKVGKALLNYVLQYAKQEECYEVTLNVWASNESARQFYQSCGFQIQKIGLEQIL